MASDGSWAESSLLPVSKGLLEHGFVHLFMCPWPRLCRSSEVEELQQRPRGPPGLQYLQDKSAASPDGVVFAPYHWLWDPGSGPEYLLLAVSAGKKKRERETKDTYKRGEYESGLRRGKAGRTPNGCTEQERLWRPAGPHSLHRPVILGKSLNLVETPLKNDDKSSHQMSPFQRGLP